MQTSFMFDQKKLPNRAVERLYPENDIYDVGMG